MKSCVFFGHRNMDVEQYKDKLLHIIVNLIENKRVTQFYSDYRGDFNRLCGNTVFRLKADYPHIKNTMALSYMPAKGFALPDCFDDSIYFPERRVPVRLAIAETNKRLAEIADYIVAGIIIHGGGAYSACEYACKRKKTIISVVDFAGF